MAILVNSVVNTFLADEPWIAYSSGKLLHNLPVHTIATSLGGDIYIISIADVPCHDIMQYRVIFRWTRRKVRGKCGKCFPK